MPYYSNIPTANQKLKDSQPLLLANFTALNAFGNGYADFPVQGSAPTFGSGDTGLYTKQDNTITTKNEMYLHRQGTSGLLEVPFTASKMSDNTAINSISGWSYLPSGLLIKWGYDFAVNGTNGNPLLLTTGVNSGGPDFTRLFTAIITPRCSTVEGDFRCYFHLFDGLKGNMYVRPYNSSGGGLTSINYMIMGV